MIKSSLFEHALFCVIWNGKIFVFSSGKCFPSISNNSSCSPDWLSNSWACFIRNNLFRMLSKGSQALDQAFLHSLIWESSVWGECTIAPTSYRWGIRVGEVLWIDWRPHDLCTAKLSCEIKHHSKPTLLTSNNIALVILEVTRMFSKIVLKLESGFHWQWETKSQKVKSRSNPMLRLTTALSLGHKFLIRESVVCLAVCLPVCLCLLLSFCLPLLSVSHVCLACIYLCFCLSVSVWLSLSL